MLNIDGLAGKRQKCQNFSPVKVLGYTVFPLLNDERSIRVLVKFITFEIENIMMATIKAIANGPVGQVLAGHYFSR